MDELSLSRETTVCFTGHRRIDSQWLDPLARRLDAAIEEAYCQGYRAFLSGAALGFDTLAAQRVLALKEKLPGLELYLIIPCEGQSRYWTQADRQTYARLKEQADGTVVLSPFYYEGCMQSRNRYLVNHASLCVCFLKEARGGTWATVSYAAGQGLPQRNLWTEIGPAAGEARA